MVKMKLISASAVYCGILLYPLAMTSRMLTLGCVNVIMNLLHVALGKGEKLFCKESSHYKEAERRGAFLCLQVSGHNEADTKVSHRQLVM
jgi:hypothetical protein